MWTKKYKQLAWVRHFDGEITATMEDALLRVIAEYEGPPFPRLASSLESGCRGRAPGSVGGGRVLRRAAAITYTRMGLLTPGRPANWFDPGRFWSGDRLSSAAAPASATRSRSRWRILSASGGHRAAGDALQHPAGDVLLDDPAVDGEDLERRPPGSDVTASTTSPSGVNRIATWFQEA